MPLKEEISTLLLLILLLVSFLNSTIAYDGMIRENVNGSLETDLNQGNSLEDPIYDSKNLDAKNEESLLYRKPPKGI